MKYQPITCVWEVTMECNMRCGHCGSSCAEALPDALTTEEALDLCDQIASLGLKWVTLSGGEPLTRKDLPSLIERLHSKGVAVNIITNGWMLNSDMAAALKKSGISTAAISIDGTKPIHDKIRKEGAFDHAERAFAALKAQGIQTGAVTTITKQNLGILEELKTELIRMNVDSWQVQLGLPMGNLKERPEWVLDPQQVNEILDFCYQTALEGKIKIFPADCIGYYTQQETQIKQISYGRTDVPLWDGCNAGIRGFGILHNGNILGCTSIRDDEFIEGNIRERSLREIWEDDDLFLWRRNMTRDNLTGKCNTCVYASKCLGGCPNTRLTMNGDIHSENQYCVYYWQLDHMEKKYQHITDWQGLLNMAQTLMAQGRYQDAAFALKQVTILNPDCADAYKAKGYCEYMCGNYEQCKSDNESAMNLNDQDAYALRGYAIARFRLGEEKEGIADLQKAVELTGYCDLDLIEDVKIMMANHNTGLQK